MIHTNDSRLLWIQSDWQIEGTVTIITYASVLEDCEADVVTTRVFRDLRGDSQVVVVDVGKGHILTKMTLKMLKYAKGPAT